MALLDLQGMDSPAPQGCNSGGGGGCGCPSGTSVTLCDSTSGVSLLLCH